MHSYSVGTLSYPTSTIAFISANTPMMGCFFQPFKSIISIPKNHDPQKTLNSPKRSPPCLTIAWLGSGHAAITWLAVEAAIVVSQAAARRGFEVAESFLGTLLGHRALDEDFWRKVEVGMFFLGFVGESVVWDLTIVINRMK